SGGSAPFPRPIEVFIGHPARPLGSMRRSARLSMQVPCLRIAPAWLSVRPVRQALGRGASPQPPDCGPPPGYLAGEAHLEPIAPSDEPALAAPGSKTKD